MLPISEDAELLHKDMKSLARRMAKKYPDKAEQLSGAATILATWAKALKQAEKEEKAHATEQG